MELTPETMDAILALLQDHDVVEFTGLGFYVKFGPKTTPQVVNKQDPEAKHGGNMWDDPRLWPGGMPPKFPGSETR